MSEAALKRRMWIRLDAHLPRNHKLAQLASDAHRWTWVLALCEAKLQRDEGSWQSWDHLLACLRGRRPSHAQALAKAGLLEVAGDGRVSVADWQTWQTRRGKTRKRDPGSAWLRLDAFAPRHRKIACLPSDAVRWAWVLALCEAKLQTPQGEWESYQHFRSCLSGKADATLAALFEFALIEVQSPARVCVRNWTRWQSETPMSGAERQRLYRDRKANEGKVLQMDLGGRAWSSDVTKRDAGGDGK